MSGVAMVLSALESLRPVPTIRTGTCTRRYGSSCTDCVVACPVQALAIGPGHEPPLVDALSCIACGLCAATCPVDAVEGVGAAPARLVAAARAAADRLSVRCAQAAAIPSQDLAHVQDVFCLGSLHPETIAAAAAAMQPHGVLDLVSAACSVCPVEAARHVESTTSSAQALARWTAPEVTLGRRVQEPPRPGPGDVVAVRVRRRSRWRRAHGKRSIREPVTVSRRDLFSRLSGQPAGTTGYSATGPSDTGGRPTPADRPRSRPRAALLAGGGVVPLPRPHVADGCTACRGCSVACPTGALRWGESDGIALLNVDPRSCIACGECVRVCPESVVTLVCDLPSRQTGFTVLLTGVRQETCSRCGDLLGPGDGGRCIRCTSRQSLVDDVWSHYTTEGRAR